MRAKPTITSDSQFDQDSGRFARGGVGYDLEGVSASHRALLAVSLDSPHAAQRARELRCSCMRWLDAPGHEQHRCTRAVWRLLSDANNAFLYAAERYLHPQPTQAMPTLPQPPTTALLQQIRQHGEPLPAVGRAMRDKFQVELVPPHWTPKRFEAQAPAYAAYRSAGGTLSRVEWQTRVVQASLEDDPEGRYLNNGVLRSRRGAHDRDFYPGLEYISDATERSHYLVTFDDRGRAYYGGAPFDTRRMQVDGKGFGWALFVLGFDNQLYAAPEVRERFQHGSFFAGEATQCAGELCCIDGNFRYLTPKSGHYRPGYMDFYRFVAFLQYHGADLSTILVAPEPKDTPVRWYDAATWFSDRNRDDAAVQPMFEGNPSVLAVPGIPQLG